MLLCFCWICKEATVCWHVRHNNFIRWLYSVLCLQLVLLPLSGQKPIITALKLFQSHYFDGKQSSIKMEEEDVICLHPSLLTKMTVWTGILRNKHNKELFIQSLINSVIVNATGNIVLWFNINPAAAICVITDSIFECKVLCALLYFYA